MPPLAFTSSFQISIEMRAALPLPASGPVRLMPKPIFRGCCACAAPAMAIERAMAPPESQLLSLLIGMSPPRSQRCLHSGFGASIEVVAPAQAGAQFALPDFTFIV